MIIIGHRGARNEAPENTLVGFEHIRSLGINHVELDIRLTKDKQLAVLHDTTLDRTTNKKGNISHFTTEELTSINAAYRFNPKGVNTTPLDISFSSVPMLNTVIEQWPNLQHIQLEVKTTDEQSLNTIADRLNFLINAHQIHRQSVITSSDTALLRIVAEKHRHITRGFVAERFRRDPINICSSLGCQYLVVDWRRCTETLIEDAHHAGLRVSVWTVNKVDIALRLQQWGVHSIITDEPTLMLKALTHHTNTHD